MYCRKCGKELSDNVKFCGKCGTEVRGKLPSLVDSGDVSASKNSVDSAIKSEVGSATKKKGNRKLVLFLCIGLLIIGLLCAGGVFAYHLIHESELSEDVFDEDNDEMEAGDVEEEQEGGTETREEKAFAEEEIALEEEVNEEETIIEEETLLIETDVEAEETAIHRYEIVIMDSTWSEAFEYAKEAGGYLVRINTADEMQVIEEQIETEGYKKGIFWIGGVRMEGDYAYYWVDAMGNPIGDELSLSEFWLEGEPSYWDLTVNVEENYMNMFYMDSYDGFVWNDTVNDLLAIAPTYEGELGFIIEYQD